MRTYRPDDYEELKAWCQDRQMRVPQPDDLPLFGLIEPGVAAGFLVMTDTRTAILDFFISNPQAHAIRRGRAVDIIILGLMERARYLGVKRLLCDTQIDTIKRKALNLAFEPLGQYSVFCKEI